MTNSSDKYWELRQSGSSQLPLRVPQRPRPVYSDSPDIERLTGRIAHVPDDADVTELIESLSFSSEL